MSTLILLFKNQYPHYPLKQFKNMKNFINSALIIGSILGISYSSQTFSVKMEDLRAEASPSGCKMHQAYSCKSGEAIYIYYQNYVIEQE